MAGARGLRVVIVGAGLGGIAAAIELRKHGFDEIRILEKAPAVGAQERAHGSLERALPGCRLGIGPNNHSVGDRDDLIER